MTTRRFRLTLTDGRWWQVIVHDTDESLQRAAARTTRQPVSMWAGARGCVHAWKDVETARELGVLRLSRENLGVEVIYHELLHLAIATCRVRSGLAYLDLRDVTDHEEKLCYVMSEVVEEFHAKF